jgi:hypothetical protein
MPKITEGQFALGGLFTFAVWLFVVLPFLYPCPEPVYGNERPANAQEQTNSIRDESPSFVALKLFTTAGRNEIGKYCAQKSNKEEEEWTHKYVCDIKITDVYLAIFNFLLVIVTAGLIAAGILTVRQMRTTEERQLRAYIFPVEAVLTQFTAGEVLKCRITTKNTGQTPAYRLRHMAIIGLVDFPPQEPLPECEASESISKTNLGPGGDIHKFGETKFPLTEAAVTRLKGGTAAIYVFGRIDFTDAFGGQRWVKYRCMTGGDIGFNTEGRLGICLDGNETSEG